MSSVSKSTDGDKVEFSTGAVRSKDAEGYRYDLVSPIGMRLFLGAFKNFPGKIDAIEALQEIYAFLSGERGDRPLAYAAIGIVNEIGGFSKAMEALPATYHEGAVKYQPYNYEKGMPVSDLLNHAIRHLVKHIGGENNAEDLPHALWGVFAAMHSEELWPHLNQNLRTKGCKPPVG